VLLDGPAGSGAAVERLLERDDLDPIVRDYLRAVLQGTTPSARNAFESGVGRAEVL
jgi:hypothetical protein